MKPFHRDAFAAMRVALVLVGWAAGVSAQAPAPAPAAAPAGAPGPALAAKPAPNQVACPGYIAASKCQGGPAMYCSGHGQCDGNGHCWCDLGYAGDDCATEVPEFLEITGSPPSWMPDITGRYSIDSMYLSLFSTNVADMRFMYYEPASSGWVISKFNSSCDDDACFFAYEGDRQTPPPKGYVFGAPNMQVYCAQLVYDWAETHEGFPRGRKLSVEYTPDPHILTLPSLGEFNAQYVFQPRYVHSSGKYMIMPINFAEQRTWIVTGMMGVPRKWRLLASNVGPPRDLYTPPQGFYQPSTYGLYVRKQCKNTYADAMCASMAGFCANTNAGFAAVRQCCRATCNSCFLSRNACPSSGPAASLLAITGISKPGRSQKAGVAKTLLAKRKRSGVLASAL